MRGEGARQERPHSIERNIDVTSRQALYLFPVPRWPFSLAARFSPLVSSQPLASQNQPSLCSTYSHADARLSQCWIIRVFQSIFLTDRFFSNWPQQKSPFFCDFICFYLYLLKFVNFISFNVFHISFRNFSNPDSFDVVFGIFRKFYIVFHALVCRGAILKLRDTWFTHTGSSHSLDTTVVGEL